MSIHTYNLKTTEKVSCNKLLSVLWGNFLPDSCVSPQVAGYQSQECKATFCGLGQNGERRRSTFYVLKNDNLVRKRELGWGSMYKKPSTLIRVLSQLAPLVRTLSPIIRTCSIVVYLSALTPGALSLEVISIVVYLSVLTRRSVFRSYIFNDYHQKRP